MHPDGTAPRRQPRALDDLNPAARLDPQHLIGERAHVRLVDDMGQGRTQTIKPRETGDAGPVERNLKGRRHGPRTGVDDPEAVPPAGKRIMPAENRNQAGPDRVRPDDVQLGTYIQAGRGEGADYRRTTGQNGAGYGQATDEDQRLQHPRNPEQEHSDKEVPSDSSARPPTGSVWRYRPARAGARDRAVVAKRARADRERNEDRASENGRSPVQRGPQRVAVESLSKQPTDGQLNRNQRRALSAVWWSSPKCFAIALTRSPRSRIAAASAAITW